MFGSKVKMQAVSRRVRHVLIAAALALLVVSLDILFPLDLVSWLAQSKLGHADPSGEIVFVEIREETLDKNDSTRILTQAISKINEAGASSTFVDIPLSRLNENKTTETQFANQIDLSNVYLVGRLSPSNAGETMRFPIEYGPLSKTQKVADGREIDPFGYIWSTPKVVINNGKTYPSFASALAKEELEIEHNIFINYRYSNRDIETFDIEDIAEGRFDPEKLVKRDIVIGFVAAEVDSLHSIPGGGEAAESFVPIFAAETIKAGGVRHFGRYPFLVGSFLLLLIAAALREFRRYAYWLLGLGVLTSIIAPIFLPLSLQTSGAITLLLPYALMRGLARWRGSIEMHSGQTGLPTLKALARNLERAQLQDRHAVIAVKLHGLSDVLAVLDDEQKLEYFGGVAKRLKIANQDLEIFSDVGEHLVWSDRFEDRGILESHLLALRAIFARPLEIDGKQVDVTVTFSADLSFTDAASRRIGNAIAMVDKTSLADLPIVIGDQQNTQDREWKVSLQASIDNALRTGAIFAVFQPKVNLKTGAISGYEALVRWNDPERGFISPAYFIEQCEQAGRMEKLTRFMLKEAMEKFQASKAYALGGSLSVNVSSTMLSNTSLPEIVCEILDGADFPEERLIIEVTETARIHDELTARSVLSALSAIGVGLSLDDFGTGSAGLETLYNYPFSEIKIDRAFVKDITKSEKARCICEQVIALGRELELNIVAEGIEDQETLEVLTDMGCPTAQGYYLGRPLAYPVLDAFEPTRLAKN